MEQIAIVFTQNGEVVADFERPGFREQLNRHQKEGRIEIHANSDFFTPLASGSGGCDALIVVPCSMGMAGRIAGGISNDLISRTADVMLKEACRKLILCPRETPFSLIHLKNLTLIKEAGGIIVPAMPSFYNHPTTLEEAADTVVIRILGQLGLKPKGYKGWKE